VGHFIHRFKAEKIMLGSKLLWISVAVAAASLSVVSAWPWSDDELTRASRSQLKEYAQTILIDNKQGISFTMLFVSFA
jgi:hypothetical protein